MDITLTIGGLVVRLREPNGYPRLAWPLRPFEGFMVESEVPADLRVDVNVVGHLPELEVETLRFDAGRGLWTLFDCAGGYVLESLHTLTHQPRARALISSDFRTVRAWVLPDLLGGQVGWCPMYLFNPIVEVCFVSLLAREGGLLLHAAGLAHHGHGYVFTGPSGAGKSTIAGRFADDEAEIFSDERVILRQGGGTTTVHGTPWVGSGEYAANDSAPLTALYTIRHGRHRHHLEFHSPSKAASLLLQQAFLPQWNRSCMEHTLDTLLSLTTQVPCYDLAFLNHPDVVDLVLHHSSSLIGAPP